MHRLNRTTLILACCMLFAAGTVGCSKSKSGGSAREESKPPAARGQARAPEATPVEKSERPRPQEAGRGRTGSALLIIAPANFRDEELAEPRAILVNAGYKVTVASSADGPVKGMLGASVKPDIRLKQVKVDAYDVVVFVGGSGAKAYFDAPAAHRIAREAVLKGKVTGAICLAPAILAKAGVLKGRRATVYAAAAKILTAGGAKLQNAPVVVDGRLVTANGPRAAAAFAKALIKVAEARGSAK